MIHRIGAAMVGAAAVLLCAGCSSTADGLNQAAGDAVSATSTARLATSLQLRGKATIAYLATVYGDALTELQGADASVSSLAATPSEANRRHEVQAAIRRAIDAVVAAQEDLNSAASLSPDLPALTTAVTALKKQSRS